MNINLNFLIMFYSVFSGYLNGEAKFNEVNGKGVLNFRVAVAFPIKGR